MAVNSIQGYGQAASARYFRAVEHHRTALDVTEGRGPLVDTGASPAPKQAVRPNRASEVATDTGPGGRAIGLAEIKDDRGASVVAFEGDWYYPGSASLAKAQAKSARRAVQEGKRLARHQDKVASLELALIKHEVKARRDKLKAVILAHPAKALGDKDWASVVQLVADGVIPATELDKFI